MSCDRMAEEGQSKVKVVKVPVYVDSPEGYAAMLKRVVAEAEREGCTVVKLDSGERCLICGQEVNPMPTGTTLVDNPEASSNLRVMSDVCDTCGQQFNQLARKHGQPTHFYGFYPS